MRAGASTRGRYPRGMVTLDEVAAWAMALPEVTEGTSYSNRAWSVGRKAFVWERPFSKADLKRFGAEPVPAGPIVAVRVDDLGEKEAVLAQGTRGLFTIPHFDGYAAVLVQLTVAPKKAVRELLVDGWLACAAPPVAADYLRTSSRRRRP